MLVNESSPASFPDVLGDFGEREQAWVRGWQLLMSPPKKDRLFGLYSIRDCAIIIMKGGEAEKLEGGHYIKLLPR